MKILVVEDGQQAAGSLARTLCSVSYTHLTLPTKA